MIKTDVTGKVALVSGGTGGIGGIGGIGGTFGIGGTCGIGGVCGIGGTYGMVGAVAVNVSVVLLSYKIAFVTPW